MEFLEKILVDQALALVSGEIKARKEKKIEFKYKEIFHMEKAMYFSCHIKNNSTPVLLFRVGIQEIDCLVSKKDKLLVEGNESKVNAIQYIVAFTPNPDPLIEELGHEWHICAIEKVGIFQQLV